MKTFKVVLCAMFVLCCGAIFSACGSKDFNERNITIGEHVFTYDGKSHIVDVSYKGVKAKVTYAFENNKNNFKSAKDLNLVNAGTYNLYYRLSAKGYETYTSNGTLELTIQQKDLPVTISDYNLIKSKDQAYTYRYSVGSIVKDDVLQHEVIINDGFDVNNLVCGQQFSMGFEIQNPNYKVVLTRDAILTVTDYVTIEKGDGTTLYFGNLQDAINEAEENDVLQLNDDVYLTEGVDVSKSVIIDGRGRYSIKAKIKVLEDETISSKFEATEYQDKSLASLLYVTDNDVELTLKDVTLNGKKVVRGVSMFGGKLNIENATITEGKRTDDRHSGGVYLEGNSSLVMTSGTITANDSNDQDYTSFGADIWIGSGSAVITSGRVDNVFVNSTSSESYSTFTLNGGNVHNVYVEYGLDKGAVFNYVSGTVEFLMISQTNEAGNYVQVTPVANTEYVGGKLDY